MIMGMFMSLVDVHNEWDPLEEVIIGTMTGARVPRPGLDLFAIEFADFGSPGRIPSGPFPTQVIEETQVELDRLSDELTRLGAKVRRPGPRDTAGLIATPEWQTDGFYDYCPRDALLAIGDTVIETPMVLRSRFLEPFAYKSLLLEYLASGSRWLSAPKPRLSDDLYDPAAEAGHRLRNLEPALRHGPALPVVGQRQRVGRPMAAEHAG
jgi:scyllo-inosamine-4-phosphate amidinotransferase 1